MNTTEETTITLEEAVGYPYQKKEKGLAVLALVEVYQNLKDPTYSEELINFACSFLRKEVQLLCPQALEVLHDNIKACRDRFQSLRNETTPAQAYFMLGQIFGEGWDLYDQMEFAAAKLGLSQACFDIAMGYLLGHERPQDFQKAESYMKKGFRKSDPDGYWGFALLAGKGKMTCKSLPFLEKGAAKGSGACAEELGQYYDDLHTEEGFQKAMFYFAKAAELDDPDGTYDFGRTFIGWCYRRVDMKKAEILLKKASDLGSLKADYALGRHYQDGDFGKKDLILAEKYFRRGVECGDESCTIGLAALMTFFSVANPDYEWARTTFLHYSNNGVSKATYALARMADCGYGEEVNHSKALAYYVLSASQGNVQGAYLGGKMAYEGKVVEKNLDLAVSLLTMAANQDDNDACDLLGKIYETGEDNILPNPELAKHYLAHRQDRKA